MILTFNSNVLKFGGFWLGFGSSPTPPPTPTIYRINVPTVQHGTVSVNPTEGPTGTLVTISTVPDTGYELDTISLTGAELINGNQFYIDGSDVTVNVTFKEHASSVLIYSDTAEHRSDWTTTFNMDTGNRYISMIIGMKFHDNYVGTLGLSGSGKTITFGHFAMLGATGDNAIYLRTLDGVSSYTYSKNPPDSTEVGPSGTVIITSNGDNSVIQPDVYNIIFDTVENTMTIYLLNNDYGRQSADIDIPNTPYAKRGTAQLSFNPKNINTLNLLTGNGEPWHGITYYCYVKYLSIKAFDNLNDALAYKGE